MKEQKKYNVLIIGGGLAGLTAALHLSKNNCDICLIEKNGYPHHKVCGEYVSNEVLPYLNELGIDPIAAGAKRITNFKVSDSTGTLLNTVLPLGGFGISRYTLDDLLYNAVKEKADIVFNTAEKVFFNNNYFTVTLQDKTTLKANFVIGAYGKRSNLDTYLNRSFIRRRSPWLAVKGHYKFPFSDDTVALHNFNGGYCGLSRTETDVVNASYLATFKSFKEFGNIQSFQKYGLSKNPYLRDFFQNAKPVFKKPLTISQISFEEKKPLQNHIFMLGDSAGLIHPLCGNGMAMAIRSAQIFSELFLKASPNAERNREKLETDYLWKWGKEFQQRLKTGRIIQKILLNPVASKIGFSLIKNVPSILPKLIIKTHGKPVL